MIISMYVEYQSSILYADGKQTDTVISHPNITYYDWPAAWDTPNTTDAANYLSECLGRNATFSC